MTNIKDRFAEKFPNGVGTLHELEGDIQASYENLDNELLAFIKEELNRLAETIEKEDLTGRNWGVKQAVAIIRTQANSL